MSALPWRTAPTPSTRAYRRRPDLRIADFRTAAPENSFALAAPHKPTQPAPPHPRPVIRPLPQRPPRPSTGPPGAAGTTVTAAACRSVRGCSHSRHRCRLPTCPVPLALRP
ncbi:hypothetical protein ACWEP4_09140, partial [Streptomyces sp. NPDC004227]